MSSGSRKADGSMCGGPSLLRKTDLARGGCVMAKAKVDVEIEVASCYFDTRAKRINAQTIYGGMPFEGGLNRSSTAPGTLFNEALGKRSLGDRGMAIAERKEIVLPLMPTLAECTSSSTYHQPRLYRGMWLP